MQMVVMPHIYWLRSQSECAKGIYKKGEPPKWRYKRNLKPPTKRTPTIKIITTISHLGTELPLQSVVHSSPELQHSPGPPQSLSTEHDLSTQLEAQIAEKYFRLQQYVPTAHFISTSHFFTHFCFVVHFEFLSTVLQQSPPVPPQSLSLSHGRPAQVCRQTCGEYHSL